MSRAYYAAFYAANAALSAHAIFPSTHRGTLTQFAKHVVKTGRMASKQAAILHEAFERRQDADYDPDDPPPLAVATDIVDRVEHFVVTVERLMGEPDAE